ncbi:hypothetical protein RR42_s2838 [Cupriavidus basilensis]|uniref:Uncharacterized protein n=1 Tax=Cupriavidus basilensis TaxID=68895 RepID=A0A0C4YQY6_9BURK|nr:hypothetical protein RR42_s2838 [Cupriavidus basilensis]
MKSSARACVTNRVRCTVRWIAVKQDHEVFAPATPRELAWLAPHAPDHAARRPARAQRAGAVSLERLPR